MKSCLLLTAFLASAASVHLRQRPDDNTIELAAASDAAKGTYPGGTCPEHLETLWRKTRNVTGVHPEAKVLDVPTAGVAGFGPTFQKGLRYLVFDEDDKSGFVGVKCSIQSAVRCMASPSGKATTNSTCSTKPCVPDVHNPASQYLKLQLGGAIAGLAAGRGQVEPVGGLAVAALGVGAGSIPGWFLATVPKVTVDAVDTDSAVFQAAAECFGLPSKDTRLRQEVKDDVAYFKSKESASLDAVLLDVAPMPKEFRENLSLMQSKLSPGGVLVANGYAHEEEWQKFKAEAKTSFASAWWAGVSDGVTVNEVLVGVTKGGDQAVAHLSKSPTAQEIVAAGGSQEAADWFAAGHWSKL